MESAATEWRADGRMASMGRLVQIFWHCVPHGRLHDVRLEAASAIWGSVWWVVSVQCAATEWRAEDSRWQNDRHAAKLFARHGPHCGVEKREQDGGIVTLKATLAQI